MCSVRGLGEGENTLHWQHTSRISAALPLKLFWACMQALLVPRPPLGWRAMMAQCHPSPKTREDQAWSMMPWSGMQDA